MFAVILLGIFRRRTSATGTYAGLGTGVAVAVGLFLLFGSISFLWRAVAVLAVALIVTWLVSYLSEPQAEETVRGTWGTLPKEAELMQTSRGTIALAVVLLTIVAVLLIIFA